jgi:hypothetical protein
VFIPFWKTVSKKKAKLMFEISIAYIIFHSLLILSLTMCCIVAAVLSVTATKLIVAKLQGQYDKKDFQFVSYVNQIELDPEYPNNAMVICVPAASKDISVSKSKENWTGPLTAEMFFAFEAQNNRAKGRGMTNSIGGGDSDEDNSVLAVEEAGAYVFSRADSLEDLQNRFNKDEFTVSPKCFEFLKSYYGDKPYSYLILRLAKSGEYHPFNYVFPMANPDELVIPTLHYHAEADTNARKKAKLTGIENERDSDMKIDYKHKPNNHHHEESGDNKTAHYDHEIYILNRNQLIEHVELLGGGSINDSQFKLKHYNLYTTKWAADVEKWYKTVADLALEGPRSLSKSSSESSSESEQDFPDLYFSPYAREYFAAELKLKGTFINADFVVKLGASIDVEHKSFICDICGIHGLRGARFRCYYCPSVDVCAQCHVNRSHLSINRFNDRVKTLKHDVKTHPLIEIWDSAQVLS